MADPTTRPDNPARMAIFAALVAAQDRGVPVARSRQTVAEAFGVSPRLVADVEREGLHREWPPLGEAGPAAHGQAT
jgi:hypothetical protein